MDFPINFFVKQNERLLEDTSDTPLGGLSPPNNVHVHNQLKNTLRPPGHKWISIEILANPLNVFVFLISIESKLISILTYLLDLKNVLMKLILMFGFAAHYLGMKTFSWI